MKLLSFGRFFGKRWLEKKSSRNRSRSRIESQFLWVEALEDRNLLANLFPQVLSVQPPDGSITPNALPVISVQYSEPMVVAEATNPLNYRLFDSTGNRITIDGVSWNPMTNTATLTYNSGVILPISTYSFFVLGDKVHDVADGLPLSLPGQVVSANAAIGNISLVNTHYDSGLMDSLSNYPAPTTPGATPVLVAFANLSGVVAAQSYTVTLGTRTGGDFTLTLNGDITTPIPYNATPLDVQTALELLPSIGTGNVTVTGFTNGPFTIELDASITGTLTANFSNLTPVPTGLNPATIVNTPIQDMVVVNDGLDPTTKLPITNIEIFQGRVGGGFDPTATFVIQLANNGTTASGVTGIAIADINKDGAPDIAVSEKNLDQAEVFLNTRGPGGVINFNGGLQYYAGAQPNGIVLADMDSDTNVDMLISNAATIFRPNTTANISNPQGVNEYNIVAYNGDGTGTFTAILATTAKQFPTPFTTRNLQVGDADDGYGLLGPGAMIARDMNNDGKPDIVVAGVNGIGVLTNASAPNSIVFNYSKYYPLAYPVAGSNYSAGNPLVSAMYPATGPNPPNQVVGAGVYMDVTVGDFNADTYLDIAGLTSSGEVHVFLNNGPAAFDFGTAPDLVIDVGGATGKLVARDLNADGYDDLLVTDNIAPGNLQVLINSKAASPGVSFAAPVLYASAGKPFGVAVADTNQDGFLDVAVAGQEIISGGASSKRLDTVSLMRGTDAGTFLVSTDIPVTGFNPNPVASAVGDLNDDGIPDLAVVKQNVGQVAVMLSTGIGTYAPIVNYTVGSQPIAVAIGDLDLDGDNDMAVANKASNTITLLFNDGTGAFPVATTKTYSIGKTPTGIALADFNNDGGLDIAVSHNAAGLPLTNRGVSVRLNQGGGLFANAVEYATGTKASSLAVTDFNRDGNMDILLTDNSTAGNVVLLFGNGTGTFVAGGSYGTVDLPTSIAIDDFNRDGYPDAVVTSGLNAPSNGQFGVMFNSFGTGFSTFVRSSAISGVVFQNITITNINDDAFPDIVLAVAREVDPINGGSRYSNNDLYSMTSNGDGTFSNLNIYQAGGPSGVTVPSFNPGIPSYVVEVTDPYMRLTTFDTGGNIVNNNLIRNPAFEMRDLAGEQGNLGGWTAWSLTDTHGRWAVYTGASSPISLKSVLPPAQGQYAAMADQSDLFPAAPPGVALPPSAAFRYTGTRLLYQDIVIPANATSLTLSLSLYLNNLAGIWSDTNNPYSLDYRTSEVNQQVRVDLVVPPGDLPNSPKYQNEMLDLTNYDPGHPDPSDPQFGYLLKNIFVTDPTLTSSTIYMPISYTFDAAELNQLRSLNTPGQVPGTVRLRFAVVNNLAGGQLLAGVDNVQLRATYADNSPPVLFGLRLRNPGSGDTPSFGGHTTDPTIVGLVADDGLATAIGSPTNIASVSFDTNNNKVFTDITDITINNWDAVGNFSVTLQGLVNGNNTIGVRARDKAGNLFTTSITFDYLGPSNSLWGAIGPAQINTAGSGLLYSDVSGRVTAIAVDPRDTSGNTYFIGSANGGVWKTTNGGGSWIPLTDNVYDPSGGPLPVSVGGMALDPLNPDVIYVATGIGDNQFDSRTGIGVLKSTDGGRTWFLAGNSGSVLSGARVTKVAVAANSQSGPNFVYVAVASGGAQGPGVYRSIDGGLTWVNVLASSNMTGANNQPVPAGTPIASVTDLIIDPFDSSHITIGVGNIGLVPDRDDTTGVWVSGNAGATWKLVTGGDEPLLATGSNILPAGSVTYNGEVTKIGRVTLAQGSGRVGDEKFLYVMIANPPPAGLQLLPGQHYTGNFQSSGAPSATESVLPTDPDYLPSGLYKSKDYGLNWTRVRVRENLGGHTSGFPEDYEDINILGGEGNDTGALVVDPNNPDVVYVGGSRRFTDNGPGGPTHGFIRVDTTYMRDTTYSLANDGDDMRSLYAATTSQNCAPCFDNGPVTNTWKSTSQLTYHIVGVTWVDLESNTVVRDDPMSGIGNTFVPNGIHALVFDAQGRLLVGTERGIWRGLSRGFRQTANGLSLGPNMTFTSLNSNLQISNLTSVAVDTVDRHTFYTSQASTGMTRTTNDLFGWGTMGQSVYRDGMMGPIDGLPIHQSPLDGSTLNMEVPSGAAVRVGAPDVGSLPGSPSQVYQLWAFLSPRALVAEYSIFGGDPSTFDQGAGIGQGSSDGWVVPPMAINPKKVFNNNQYYDQLIVGTDRVYQSNTGSRAWSDLVGRPLSSRGGVVTSLAIANTPLGGVYAGTDKGEIFVTLNNGLDNWPERSAGLPNQRVNGITVHPNNPLIAYAMFNGRGNGHVFKTTNGGVTWTNISSNLPDFPTYAMAIDPRKTSSAPGGRLYVGTEVGVYVSYNGGLSWSRLGLGLPNVPVVDIQLNTKTDTLAVATQGRGAFTIAIDTNGPYVTGVTPNSPVLPPLNAVSATNLPLNTVTVTFNEPLDPRTFTISSEESARTTTVGNFLVKSTTYLSNLIKGYYQKFLLRAPTTTELSAAVSAMRLGRTAEKEISILVGSKEYFATRAANNNTQWVNEVYMDLLGRAPLPSEETTALTQLNSNVTRANVAYNNILTFSEYRTNLITEYYNKYLRRPPTQAEITDGLATFTQNGTDQKILSGILGTLEYYRKNGSATYVDSDYATAVLDPDSNPTAVAVGDFNNDGFSDVVIAIAGIFPGNERLAIFEGKSGGGYQPAPTILTLPLNSAPAALAVADFNGDSLPDIAVANSGTDDISVFLNTTAGPISFSPAAGSPYGLAGTGTVPSALVVADFDGDGIRDIAVGNKGADGGGNYNVSIFPGMAGGTFGAPVAVNAFVGSINGLAQDNLNVNPRPELVVAGGGGLIVLDNTSTPGSFTFVAQPPLSDQATNSVAIGFIDTDATLDIVSSANFPGGVIDVYQNQGNLVFLQAANGPFSANFKPTSVAIADFNGDGLNDVVVANNMAQGTFTVLLNDTQPNPPLDLVNFRNPVSFGTGSNPVGLALADTNQDLLLDVITANSVTDDFWTILGYNDGSFHTPLDSEYIINAFMDVLGVLPTTTQLKSLQTTLSGREQIRLVGPRGTTSPLEVVDIDPANHAAYQLTFAPQTFDGTYTLTIGTNVRDASGNRMNQNRNTINGQVPADRGIAKFAINSSDDGQFVSGLIHDVLGRQSDTTLFLSLLGKVDTARNNLLTSYARKYVTSLEYRTDRVTNYLNLYLAGDLTNLNLYVNQLKKGLKDENVIANILGSGDYFTLHGSDNTAWVNAIYTDLLNRLPTATELSTALGKLARGITRTGVALGLARGKEFRTITIQSTYNYFLDRMALPLELPALLTQMAKGLESFLITTLKSQEYFQRVGNTNLAWMTRVLGPTQLNLSSFNMFDTTLTLGAQTAGTFILNFNGKNTVKLPFNADALTIQTALEALPTVDIGNVTVVGAVGGPFTITFNPNLTGILKGNFTRLSVPKNASIQNAEYPSFLTSYWVTRQKAANTVLLGTEYLRNLVNGWYGLFMKRPPTTAELNARISLLKKGTLYRTIMAGLVSSQEYFVARTGGPGVTPTSNTQWLDNAFVDILGRSRDTVLGEGVVEFLNPLNAGTKTRMQIATALMTTYKPNLASTPEYRTNLIQKYYTLYLGRAATPTEVSTWLAKPNSGPNDRIMISTLLGSNEYFQLAHQFP